MTALQIECTCREWWGDRWADSRPYGIDARPVAHSSLPNAPVTVYVVTRNAMEAAQLLRLAADALEREPEVLEQMPELFAPVHADDDEGAPF